MPRYRRLTFKSHRLSRGVDLVADGPVPVCVRNEAGWTLSATSTPAPEAMPERLIAALGGQVAKKER